MTITIRISDNSPMSDVSKSKVVAVTVTYNIDSRFEIALKSYLDQVDLMVIVDNSTSSDAQALLREIVQLDGKRINLIQNGENLGLAKAQNIGITTALDERADWVLLMDDDSSATEQMVCLLKEASQRYNLATETAILVPQLQEQGVRRDARYVVSPNGRFRQPLFGIDDFSQKAVLQNLYIAISSGSLVKADLIREIGLIRESFN
ncbi:MAG: glycosyltransferase, partial [Candidatus Thiodiazotropha sp. 6PDIVS]